VYLQEREYDKAISAAERAVRLDPGSCWTNYRYGIVLNYAGRIQESISLSEKAIRLNPLGPTHFFYNYGVALRDSGRIEDAITAFKKAIERAPNYLRPHRELAAAYIMSGRDQEAHAEVAEVLRINPNSSVEKYVKGSWFKDQERTKTSAQALRKAGLPNKSSSDKPSVN